jgi:hypothetical protein
MNRHTQIPVGAAEGCDLLLQRFLAHQKSKDRRLRQLLRLTALLLKEVPGNHCLRPDQPVTERIATISARS